MTDHVYEMNKRMNEEQSTSFVEQLILPCLNEVHFFKCEEINDYITEHTEINVYLI